MPLINTSAIVVGESTSAIEKSDSSVIKPIPQLQQTSSPKKILDININDLDRRSPNILQNNYGFPPVAAVNGHGMFSYDMNMDYSSIRFVDGSDFESQLTELRKSLNMGEENRQLLYKTYTENYNRFKTPNLNDQLSKGFAHIFFTRPHCNILNVTSTSMSLPNEIKANPNFYYAFMHSPELLRQLTIDSGYDHDFLMYLSNKAESFPLSDEYISTDNYGRAYTGHKISYGKHNIESKTAGDFDIDYTDDRDLHIMNIHKLWVDYISSVYTGAFSPKYEYIMDRILDYTCSVYFILTAEDNETIIFWSKYWGVYPTKIPSSAYSWSKGNVITRPEVNIKYNFSFKEDFNPLSLVEFNMNARLEAGKVYKYLPIYDKLAGGVGKTWVGKPFIETINNSNSDLPYTFKLRFLEE